MSPVYFIYEETSFMKALHVRFASTLTAGRRPGR